MSITYNAGTNEITIQNQLNVTLQDIYDADVAGGWGVFDKLEELYFSSAHIKLVNAGIKDNYVALQIGTSGNERKVTMDSNSSWKFDYSFLFVYQTETSSFYNCVFNYSLIESIRRAGTYPALVFSYSEFNKTEIICYVLKFQYTLTFSRSVAKATSGYLYYLTNSIIENSIITTTEITLGYTNEVYIRNTNLDCSKLVNNYVNKLYLIDCKYPDNLHIKDNGDEVYIGYTFYPKIIDNEGNKIQGAIVKLTNSQDEEVVNETTDSEGNITSQDVYVKKIYDSDEKEINYNPFELNISYNYNELELTNITINKKWDYDLFPIKNYTKNELMNLLKAIYVK